MSAMNNYSASSPLMHTDDTIQCVGGRQTPEFQALTIEVASMTAFDYVFLSPPNNSNQPISDQHSLSLAFQLIEELDLSPERTTFIGIEIDDQDNNHYNRFELQCVDQIPIDLKRSPIINHKHIHFIETIHQHASSYRA